MHGSQIASQLGESIISSSIANGGSLSKLDRNQIQEAKLTQAALTFIIQSESEIAPWKKTTPISTQDLN
jgi:hypothetical protein